MRLVLGWNIHDSIPLRVTAIRIPRIYDAPDYKDANNPRGSPHASPNMRSRVPEAEQQQGDKERADAEQISYREYRHYLETVELGMGRTTTLVEHTSG